MPSAPGNVVHFLETGCTSVKFQFKNSVDPAHPNPPGTRYLVQVYNSNWCTPGYGTCNDPPFPSHVMVGSATVTSQSGSADEALSATVTNISPIIPGEPFKFFGPYFGTVMALSSSGDPTLNSAIGQEVSGNSFSLNQCDTTPGGSPVLDHIDVTPPNVSVTEGQTQPFTAQGYDQFNQPFNIPVTWSVVDNNKAVSNLNSINSSGLFTAGNTPGGFLCWLRAAEWTAPPLSPLCRRGPSDRRRLHFCRLTRMTSRIRARVFASAIPITIRLQTGRFPFCRRAWPLHPATTLTLRIISCR